MDAIDKKILSLLGQNARIPLKKIAEQVFLSPPAVSARIERMESSGIITISNVVYNYVIVKKPSDATKENSWGDKAKKADGVLATSAKNSDKKIEIGVKVVGDDYVAIVAKAATKAAK